MANEPKINLALVGEMPENPVRGTVYMSPDASGNFVKVGVDGSVRTIFDGSDYVRKDESVWIPGYGEKSAVLANDYSYAAGDESVSHGSMTYARGANSHAEGAGLADYPISVYSDFRNNIIYDATNVDIINIGLYVGLPVGYNSVYAMIIDAYFDKRAGAVFVLDKPLLADGSDFIKKTEVYLLSGGIAAGECSHTEGDSTVATGNFSHAEGCATYAGSTNSHAEGVNTATYGDGAHAEGFDTLATGSDSHAEGYTTIASGEYSHAEGNSTRASGEYSHAEGEGQEFSITINGSAGVTHYTVSNGSLDDVKVGDIIRYLGIIPRPHILPYEQGNPDSGFTYAIITEVHSGKNRYIGVDNTLSSRLDITDSSAYILQGVAEGTGSHSEGYCTNAVSNYSHSEGTGTRTLGDYSHAEGNSTTTFGSGSHAEGESTIAFGSGSHAEGESTIASGNHSHAEGNGTDASGDYSHAEGCYTYTSNAYEHAQGSYNMSHNYNTNFGNSGNTLDSIGIGVSDASRSNAIEVMQNGDVYVKGIGSYDGSNYVNASTLQEVVNSGGGGSAEYMMNVTYSGLKALRDSSSLVPGMQYRITDYRCTTTQADTSTAGHVFDIIITADSSTELNENARATQHINSETITISQGQNNFTYPSWMPQQSVPDALSGFSPSNNDQILFVGNGGNVAAYNSTYGWDGDLTSLAPGSNYTYLSSSTTAKTLTFENIDPYFANCNLKAWELKYCLDNDTNRFAWADTSNGKGVVYYMKDEWSNECPYDFKNIQFKRWAITMDQDHPSLVVDSQDNNYGFYYGAKSLSGDNVLLSATYGNDFGWFYTFALKDLATEDWYDYTVVAHLGLKNNEGNDIVCYDNHLEPATNEYSSGKGEMAKMLNNIVFFNCYTDLSETSYADDYSYCSNNRFQGICSSNTFGISCGGNMFGNYCQSNTFGSYCQTNTFGNICGGNTFGNLCVNNTFGNICGGNTFGNNCGANTFGNFCGGNTFGNLFQNNMFGNECGNNTFGNICGNNTFGNNCGANTFGNDCDNNTFGNFCSNTFGNICGNNTFGNDCGGNTFGNYCQQLTVFNSVHYCSVTGGTQQAPVKNAQILDGTEGTNISNKLTITFEANKNYTQIAGLNSSGVLKIWTPADLID